MVYSKLDEYRQNLLNNSIRGETAGDIKAGIYVAVRRLTQM
jgi:hypothetical protein